jgi:hypothetical protein
VSDSDTALSVIVTLATPPVWYEPDYWNTHEFDSFDGSGSYADKPKVTVAGELHETLGQVIDRAADELGLRLGAAHEKLLHTRVSEWLNRMGFYRPDDDEPFDEHRMYDWPRLLTIARESGVVEEVPWPEVTYRELVASSRLGLVEGDVLRPYISGSMRQGGPQEIAEGVRVTVEAIHHVYAALPDARSPVDDLLRISGLVSVAQGVVGGRRKFKAWRGRRCERRRSRSCS